MLSFTEISQLYVLLLACRWIYFTYSKLCLPRFIASDRTINAANVHDIVGTFSECCHGGGRPGGYEDASERWNVALSVIDSDRN